MLEREENELLQDYRYRRNILQEITLDDIEKWNNMNVDVDWDKITNKPSTFPPSTHTHNFEDLLEKPTTLEGYGITDVYTKDEIQDNTLNKFKAINGKVLVDTGFNLGLKDGDNLISYNYGTSGAPTLRLGSSAYISSYMSNMDIVAPTQLMLKTGNLNLKTKLLSLQGSYGSFSVDVSDNKGNNKLYASIPAEFTDIVRAPRINIYSGNNTVLEGALWNSTYNINGAIKDGLHLSHENGKYLALAYKNASTGIYNSYMIFDVEGVLKNDSDGDDWGPVRFEQNVFFRHGLKIGGGEDIILAGKGVNTRITVLENAISQGTGMVEWNNVLNKPSTFTPSIHSHAISDITSLQSALDGKAASNHSHSYLPLSGGNLTGDLILNGASEQHVTFNNCSKSKLQTYFYKGNSTDSTTILGLWDPTNKEPIWKVNNDWTFEIGKQTTFWKNAIFNNAELTFSNGKGIYGKDSKGVAQRFVVIGADDCCYLGGVNLHTYIRSSDCPQYLDSSGNKYNIYHSGNDPWRIKTLGKADMDTTVNSRGQGFLMKEAYNGTSSGYPKEYGNVLRMGGTGSNELFFEWCDGTAGMIYHRCLRDVGTSWTPWRRLAYADELNNYLPKSGGTITGDITAQAINVGNNCPIRGRETSNGLYKTLVYMNGQNQVVLGSGSNSVTIQIPALDKLAIWDDATKKSYNIYHSGNFTPSNYLPKSGGTLTGDIILSNSTAIKGNISGTAQDLIKFGIYATQSGNTQATILGNSNYPTISLGSLYEGNYRVLNSNNFTSYCPSISDLDNYLNKSGGTMTGEIALAQDKGIISANAEGGTLLVETSSSVNVGKTTKNLNLNCSLAYMNGARVLTEYNYASYVLPKTIFAGLFSPDKTIGTDSNAYYNYSKKTVYKSADCTVGTDRITISKAGVYKVTATWGGVPKSGTANTSAMRFTIQQRNSSDAVASKVDTITVTTLNRTAKSTVSYLFKCSANDYFIFFSYFCTVTFESEDVEIEIVRIS